MKTFIILAIVLISSAACRAQSSPEQESLVKKLSEYLSIKQEHAGQVIAATKYNLVRIDSLMRTEKIITPERKRLLNSLVHEQKSKLSRLLDSTQVGKLKVFYEKENLSRSKIADMKKKNDLTRRIHQSESPIE